MWRGGVINLHNEFLCGGGGGYQFTQNKHFYV